jgi:glucan phosphoethanolaminetransferase (alkaline phosphatase superfamily)
MQLAEGIRKHGFRKWYERELLQSHAHLLLLFVCSIGLLASFGVYSAQASVRERVLDIMAIVLLFVVGLWSLRRYLYLLMHAEQIANQAVCIVCKTYGRFLLVDARPEAQAVTVRCRKCEHEWTISDY